MALWAKRLTSLAAAFALSGCPAVLSACMALCLQVVPAAAAPQQRRGPASHAAHTSVAVPAVASGHAHHPAPTSPELVASAAGNPSPDSLAARLIATCDNCCPDGVAFVAGLGAERTDVQAFSAAPTVSPVAPFLVTSAVGAEPHRPPLPPPLPTRAPLVLRI